MEQSLADLLRDAFEEASGPCFHKADLDIEKVYFEEGTSTIFCENMPTKEKENLHQEVPTFCYSDIINTAENVEEEPPDEAAFQGEVVVSTAKSQEECYTSSWEDSAQEGEDEEDEREEMKLEKQLLLAYIGSSTGDRVRPSVERRPLPPEGDENTPVRNEEQGETESDEISYFQRVPEHGSKTERTEDDQQEIDEAKSDSESEGLKSEEEEEEEEEEDEDDYDDEHKDEEEEEEDNVCTLCFEQEVKNPHWDDPAGDILDFLELRVQHLQDLIADDEEEPVQKMEDFSGEDHQEAGESFAEYPSDFSSCEYIEQGEGDEESNGRCTGDQGTERRVTVSETSFVGNRETEQWKAELPETMSGDITAMRCETSGSYSSGDEEPKVTSEDLENQLDEHHSGSRDDLLVDNEGFPDVTLCPAEGVGMSLGSLDDSFFFSAVHQNPQISELGDFGDDEYEENSNWEQEQERIRAFNEFYEDSDQLTGQEGRQTKVQFSTELFSQVILYEIDSSDRDSLSSSTDGEEELISAETPEEPKESVERAEIKPSYDVPNTRAQSVSHLSQTQKRKQRCLDLLKVTLTMGVITVTGLLMLWWATDQAGWLSQVTFH